MGRVLIKPGVKFVSAPAGMRILDALRVVASKLNIDVTITSGADGEHSGPTDPHYTGEAYDIRSHDMSNDQKLQFIHEMMHELKRGQLDQITDTSGGFATVNFFGFLEHPGQPTEHFHFQRRNGTVYTFSDYLAVRA